MKTNTIIERDKSLRGGTRTPCGLSDAASRLTSSTDLCVQNPRSTFWKFPFLTFVFGSLALVVFSQPGWAEALEMNRVALAQGQLWRLFTGHFTHFSADHLRWDSLVFIALGSLVELRNRRHFTVVIAASALLISFGVCWLQPQFASYRGLSGIDSALFGYIAIDILTLARADDRRGPAFAAGLALVLFVAKTLFELITGRTVFVDNVATFAPVPVAHLLGAFAGGISALDLWAPRTRTRECSYPA